MNLKIKMRNLISKHWRVMLIQVLLLIIVFISWSMLNSKSDVLSIAVIVEEAKGTKNPEVEALKLYAERINKYGGINGGKELHIKAYFGHNNVSAKAIAEDIVNRSNIIAVVGNFSHKLTQPIIDIYEQANLPLLLRGSTSEIKGSSIFHMSPSAESYGKYMAVYMHKVLNKKSAIILHSDKEEDHALMTAFSKAFKSLGGELEHNILLNGNSHLEHHLKKNFESNNSDAGIVLLAQNEQTKKMIVGLKRLGINHSIISKENNLQIDAKVYEEEKQYAGYFSNNIFSPVSIIRDHLDYDIASIIEDYTRKYPNELVEQESIHSLLSLMVIAVRIADDVEPIEALREDLMVKLKRSSAFDENQQVMANSLTMGQFSRQYFRTAPITPTTMKLVELMEANKSKLLTLDRNTLYPTDTVSTGISMNKISDIDMENLHYQMDFFLWFRYQHGLENVEDIEFLNAMKPVNLLDLVNNKDKPMYNIDMNATLVERTLFNGEEYALYHVIGKFKTAEAQNYALGRQNLYVKFRNRHITRYKLSYITDYFNTNMGLFSQEALKKSNNLKELKFDVIDEPSLTLNYNLSYISSSYKTMLGNPMEISTSNNFSKFTAQYSIKHTLWSTRGIESWINTQLPGGKNKIEIPAMVFFLSLFMMIFIFTLYGHKKELFPKTSTYWWVLQLLIIFLILLFGEFALSQTIFDLKYSDWGNNNLDTINSLMHYMNKTIAVLWWIVPAYYITSAFEQFLWEPIKRQTGAEVPNVLRMFVTIVIYMLAIMGIMAFVFEVTVTSLAATSGVLAVMFAVASKVDISNIIAGLGISFSKVFKLGDWVKIGDVEGKVVEMTPRSTKVLTFDSSIINIPNTTVSGAIIENYTHPHKAYRLMIHLEIVPVYRFEQVEKVLLDAVASTENILDTPSPVVIFKGQGDSAQIFEIFFFIDDYSKKAILWESTWRRIWRHLEQADIVLATPQREVFLPKASVSEIASPLTVLNNCAEFDGLSEEKKEALSKQLIGKNYRAGERILKGGAVDESRFIITEGVVSFKNKTNEKELKRLGVAEVFDRKDVSMDVDVVAKTDTKVFILK